MAISDLEATRLGTCMGAERHSRGRQASRLKDTAAGRRGAVAPMERVPAETLRHQQRARSTSTEPPPAKASRGAEAGARATGVAPLYAPAAEPTGPRGIGHAVSPRCHPA